MRVIAGSAGGIQLQVPKRGVRPTMDRVKAAIFSSLGGRVQGARVLDLFAGTGALGLEALSRGAASVLFLDHDKQSISAVEQNLKKTKLHGLVRQQDVFAFLSRSAPAAPFDLIFADPPYENAPSGERFTDQLLLSEDLPRLLAANGIFVLEKRPDEKLADYPLWEIGRRKTYGATEVLFLSAIRDPQSAMP